MTGRSARQRLDTPRTSRRFSINVDPEAVGQFSESIARFLGTGRYLLWQTIIVVVWIALNMGAIHWRWDPYPFILLNLVFSTQAAYAAPLILLAQNRQENRDRVALDEDRRRAAQTKADTEYLARELAALRLAVGEVATRDYLRRELDELRAVIEESQSVSSQPEPSSKGNIGERRAKRVTKRADPVAPT
jgi:uncharacterized membrane protein